MSLTRDRRAHPLSIVLALLAGLAVWFYRLDEPQVKQMERELAARRPAPPERRVEHPGFWT